VANARILTESGFTNLYVPSAPGDAGCALGAALYAERIYFGQPDRPFPDHPYLGPDIDESALAVWGLEDGRPTQRLDDDELIEQIADELLGGRIVGWMDGRSEFGPRALGARSILAAPHDAEMRDRLNRDIKHREEFRPFAPVVTAEAAHRYFELPEGGARLGRFMSGVFPVRAQWRDRLAAITHVDGTARVQVLEREAAPRLYALLKAYGRRSGMPVLLNTSFNLAGEPIVNNVAEGYSTFRRCGMDLLVAGRTVMRRRHLEPAAKSDVTGSEATA
jgi:carbamoyltransferase